MRSGGVYGSDEHSNVGWMCALTAQYRHPDLAGLSDDLSGYFVKADGTTVVMLDASTFGLANHSYQTTHFKLSFAWINNDAFCLTPPSYQRSRLVDPSPSDVTTSI